MFNLIKTQFKTFFSKSYSKPFVVICLIVVALGAIYSLYAVSNLKSSIDTQIAQRQEELGTIFDEQDKRAEAEYQMAYNKYKQCLDEYRKEHNRDASDYIPSSLHRCGSEPFRVGYSVIGDTIFGNRYPARYLEDSRYRELIRTKNTSSFQLFFEKLGFGWWGIIALVAVFFINVLILFFKSLKKYIPLAFRAGNLQIKSAGVNVRSMPAFQRYLLFIALIALIILMLILFKL